MRLTMRPALRQIQCCTRCGREIEMLQNYATAGLELDNETLACRACFLELGDIEGNKAGGEE